jgi:hypothetical protein
MERGMHPLNLSELGVALRGRRLREKSGRERAPSSLQKSKSPHIPSFLNCQKSVNYGATLFAVSLVQQD